MAAGSMFGLGCVTCQTSRHVTLDDAHQFVAEARAFFIAHAGCRTTIDLTSAEYDGWRAPTDPSMCA